MNDDLQKDFKEESLENSSDSLNDSVVDETENEQELFTKLKEENRDLENKYKRALADYQNLVRHSAEEKKEFLKYSLEEFLLEILPIYDNLNISISSLSEDQNNNPWVEGVKYTIKQFDDFFSRNGVEKIETVGKKFDYNTMEAVEGEGDYVVRELRPGYKFKEKVIIPARIVAGEKE